MTSRQPLRHAFYYAPPVFRDAAEDAQRRLVSSAGTGIQVGIQGTGMRR
jgi:hypothetical protein